MKFNSYISILILTFFITPLKADDIVIQLNDVEGKKYYPFSWNDIDLINFTNSELDTVTMSLYSKNGKINKFNVDLYEILNGATVPLITITTDEEMDQIPDKINYQKAKIEVKGFGKFEDFKDNVEIRGRGNTSWTLSDKKPYRLKFDKKKQLCDLKKAKNYVLTANWTDESLLQNSIASFIGKMFDIPYTHTYVPVDVVLNGIYRGSYLLTNKPGINAGSVDIDEDNSIMWELDISYDEDLKFKSDTYDMPVMVADPDLSEVQFEYWKNDYNEMEKAVKQGRASEYIDIDEYVRYRMVYYLLRVTDIGFPKSMKLYKTKGEKYKFGPLWDFDVAMGFNWSESYSPVLAESYFWENNLMVAIDNNNGVKELIKDYLKKFLERESEVWDFIDSHSSLIAHSAYRNNIAWSYNEEEWEKSVERMKKWLHLRFEYIKKQYDL